MSALHDQELADVLELERLKRARRVRKACDSTVPSLDPDEIAARVLHTLDNLKMSASGGGLDLLPAGVSAHLRRGKAAPPSPRTPTPLSAATETTNGRSRSPASSAPGTESSPGHSGGRAAEPTTNGGAA